MRSAFLAATLIAATSLAALVSPACARDARETARVVKGLAIQGGNQKVIDALKVLEDEGFLGQMSDALSDGAASATAAPAEAPAQPGASEDQIVQIAFAAAEPIMSKHMGGKVKIGQKWVKETTRSGKPIYEVKIMPESMGIVSFFVTYTVDVDKATMKVTRVK